MKFDYEPSDEGREVVAFIDAGGNLVVNDKNCEEQQIVFHKSLSHIGTVSLMFDPSEEGIQRRFYRGDTIKITF